MPLKTAAHWLAAELSGFRFYRPGFPPGYTPVLADRDLARKTGDKSGAHSFGSKSGTIAGMGREARDASRAKFKAVGPKR